MISCWTWSSSTLLLRLSINRPYHEPGPPGQLSIRHLDVNLSVLDLIDIDLLLMYPAFQLGPKLNLFPNLSEVITRGSICLSVGGLLFALSRRSKVFA